MNAITNVGPVVSATMRMLLVGGCMVSTWLTLAQTNVLTKTGPGATPKASDATTQTNSVTFIVDTVIGEGMPPLRQRMYAEVSNARVEILGTIQVEDFVALKGVRLDLEKKVAYRFNLDSPSWKAHIKTLMWTFSNPVAAWPNGKMEGAEKVREMHVDGRTVDVYRFRTLDQKLWISDAIGELHQDDSLLSYIDRQSELPMRIELNSKRTGHSIIWKDFQWNIPLSRDLFSLSIPDGYITIDGPIERTIPEQAAKEQAATLIGDKSGPPAAQVAFGGVLRNIKSAETLTCTVLSQRRLTIKARLSLGVDGYRVEIPGLLLYVEDPKQGKAMQLNPSVKRVWRWSLDKDSVTATRQRFPNLLDLFRNVTGDQGTTTNTNQIKGRWVVVFHVDKFDASDARTVLPQARTADLWVSVDPRTSLPVQISLRLDDGSASFMWEDIQWNIRLDPEIFAMAVPADYTVIEQPPPEGGLGLPLDVWTAPRTSKPK